MKRLSELQYTSRMQGEQNPIEPADITAGDMMDDDIFGEYAAPIEEPADVTTGDMAGTPYESYDDEFFEPADVTPGDMYENIILTEANPFRKRKRVREENVDTVDYKGYTITVHRNGAGMYTAKNDYGEPYSNVPQFKTAKEAIAWDKKNLDELVDELDESTHISEKYGVYSKGGSIGSKNDEPVKVFDTAEEAKDYAKRMRKLLTPGERSHYKMGYITKPIKEASTRWHVRIPANVYDGRYYDYRYVAVVAPGETAADAVAYVKAHPEEFIAKIDGMRAGNKRKVKKPTEKNIWIEKAFAGSKIVEAHSHSPSAEFSNEFSITVKDAKKLARTYGCDWDVDGDVWTMTDVDEHVFTYLPKEGKLFTDFDQDQVIEMIKEPLQGVRESKDEVKLLDLEDELDKWGTVANKSDKEAVTKRKELKKQIAALKKKIGLKEGAISPSELIDPESEYSITDEEGNIPDELASVGNYRNPDNEINQMEDMFGKDTAADMLAYRNSIKQRMHNHLFDTHEWSAEDDQSDWDDKIEYFYGDLHDNYGDEEEWDDDTAREVATTHMYGHPRWDESATELDCLRLEEALLHYREATGSSKAREYLTQVGDPADATYEDYLEWLDDQGIPEMKISRVWFNTNRKRLMNTDTIAPKKVEPSFGRKRVNKPEYAQLKREKLEKAMDKFLKEQPQGTFPVFAKQTREQGIDVPRDVATRDLFLDKQKRALPPKAAKAGFDEADQDAVESIIRRAGYKMETMWGDDRPVTIYHAKDGDSMNAYIETGDRGPRTDHGGGDDGDDWMDSSEIERNFAPYRKRWAPRAEALEQTLKKEGYPGARVFVDYGEKGHISLQVSITSKSNKQESKMREFGPLAGPARGSAEEPRRRNANGWEKHPDEIDLDDDDLYDDYDMEPDDFFDDEIIPSDRDEEDDIYDDMDEFDYDGDVWFPESKRKLKESVEDDILAKVIINIDENYTEDTIGDDQIYFYFSQVFNDSYYPESEEEIPEIVEELTHRIFAARDEDQEEDQDFDDDDDNYGFMESGKRLIENSIVNEIMGAVDGLVADGCDIETAKAKVADRYSDSFNADDLYEILYNDYSDDEDDFF